MTYHIISTDGVWLGSSPILALAEALRDIYPGSTVIGLDAEVAA